MGWQGYPTSQRATPEGPPIELTPLSTSAPTRKNEVHEWCWWCCAAGGELGVRGLDWGEPSFGEPVGGGARETGDPDSDDSVAGAEGAVPARGRTGMARLGVVGGVASGAATVAVIGEAVSRPLSQRPLPGRSEALPMTGDETDRARTAARVTGEEGPGELRLDPARTSEDEDAFGLGAGDGEGVRRGEGSGNSCSSSSSRIGVDTVSDLAVLGKPSLRSMTSGKARTLGASGPSRREIEGPRREPPSDELVDGCLWRSTSSTLMDEKTAAMSAWWRMRGEWRCGCEEMLSTLRLRLRRALRENCSSHSAPCLRHASNLGTQSAQHGRKGTVTGGERGGSGRDGRRAGIRGVRSGE